MKTAADPEASEVGREGDLLFGEELALLGLDAPRQVAAVGERHDDAQLPVL